MNKWLGLVFAIVVAVINTDKTPYSDCLVCDTKGYMNKGAPVWVLEPIELIDHNYGKEGDIGPWCKVHYEHEYRFVPINCLKFLRGTTWAIEETSKPCK